LIPDRFFIEADGYVFAGRRLGEGSVDYMVPEQTTLPLSMKEISIESAEAIRISAGIPSVPRDTEAGGLNPVESGLLSAVSFEKGCYLGQEVVARVHRLKRVSRRLVRLAPADGETAPPAVPGDLHQDGSVVGGLTSVGENSDSWQAIAWLKSRIEDGEQAFDGGRFRVETLPES
jgi:folate-binding protein YgfZ